MKNKVTYLIGYLKLRLYKVKCKNLKIGKKVFFHPRTKLIINDKNCLIEFGNNCLLLANITLTVNKNSSLILNDNVVIKENCNFEVGNQARLEIGKKTFFNSYCNIVCLQEITIGDNVAFGPDVYIFDNNHIVKKDCIQNWNEFTSSSISIGSNSWIGAKCLILKNTNIASNCVVAGMSVVNCNIEKNKIYYNRIEKKYKDLD